MDENLIQWNRWHQDSFAKAEKHDKAVFLFVSHEGCRWCTLMQSESFTDTEIAGLVERDFIPLWVDSDERPDISRQYHRVFTQMTGREAGAPLCLFLSPEKVPLYAASYLPDRDREGMMGLRETLELVGKKYQQQRPLLLKKGREVLAAMEKTERSIQATTLDPYLMTLVAEQLKTLHDDLHGGFGEVPKFQRLAVLEMLMDHLGQKEDATLRTLLAKTLEGMCDGALRDVEMGGFYHYSKDAAWLQPAGGKKVYDNALMAQILFRAADVLGEERYREIGLETVGFMQSVFLQEGFFVGHKASGTQREGAVIVSWNAMAIKALFVAGAHDRVYHQLAIEMLQGVLASGMQEGELVHCFLPSGATVSEGFLEDYAFVCEVLLSAYAFTKEAHYLSKTSELINTALKRFFNGGLWQYSAGEIRLDDVPEDGATPSALAVMAGVLKQAATLIDPAYEKFWKRTVEIHSYALMREPLSMPTLVRSVIGDYIM